LEGDISRIRAVFNFARKNHNIQVRWGDEFNKPSKAVLRRHKKNQPKKWLEPGELRALLKEASPQLRAMIYLALNAGYGNRDCAELPRSVLDLNGGWITYAREKTGIGRRCPLWKETVAALKVALAKRPTPKVECDNVFITRFGDLWIREEELLGEQNEKTKRDDPISKEFGKLARRLNLKRKGVGFYALRHIFFTVAKRHDKDCARALMGHAEKSGDMSPIYDEDEHPVEDKRLLATVNFVRTWLNPKAKTKRTR
jgi:integrase